jgi:uncharacterized protein YydD (DUF2326 family)
MNQSRIYAMTDTTPKKPTPIRKPKKPRNYGSPRNFSEYKDKIVELYARRKLNEDVFGRRDLEIQIDILENSVGQNSDTPKRIDEIMGYIFATYRPEVEHKEAVDNVHDWIFNRRDIL